MNHTAQNYRKMRGWQVETPPTGISYYSGETLFAQEASKLETLGQQSFHPVSEGKGNKLASCKIKRHGVFLISKSSAASGLVQVRYPKHVLFSRKQRILTLKFHDMCLAYDL